MKLESFVSLIRLSHWLKNVLIFFPVFFAGKILEIAVLFDLSVGFLCFSLVTSAVYILNDLFDIEHDRNHPANSKRPLASGKVSVLSACIVMVLFLFLAGLLSTVSPDGLAWIVLILYFVINLFYSYKLKKIPVLDVFILALGFLTRICYGGIISETTLSKWLILMIFLLSLFLGFAKRRSDLLISKNLVKKRNVLHHYNIQFLDVAIILTLAISLICYIMYSISDEIIMRFDFEYVYLSSIFVLYGVIRYLQHIYVFENALSPTRIAWTDKHIQLSILCWVGFYTYLLYAN